MVAHITPDVSYSSLPLHEAMRFSPFKILSLYPIANPSAMAGPSSQGTSIFPAFPEAEAESLELRLLPSANAGSLGQSLFP